VYQNPSTPLEEDDLDTLIGLSKSKKCIFRGDLNAKHTDLNSRLITSRGRKLARHADKNLYAISAPDSPTYYSNRTNVHLDVFDIYLHHMKDVETLDELNSDHNPVFPTVDSSMTANILQNTSHLVRKDEFRRYLKQIELPLDSFLSTDALEISIEAFSNIRKSAKIARS
jgi:Endonuclease/Exonuclease/phosphatase family.